MESGKLMSAEVLPKVAKQMAEMARQGGALEIKMKSNRAAMNRMRTAFQDLQHAFFRSGFGDFTRRLFDTLTNSMIALIPIANVLGTAINVAFSYATLPIRALVGFMSDLVNIFGGEVKGVIQETIGYILGILGAVGLVIVQARLLAVAFGFIKPILVGVGALIAAVGGVPLAIAAGIGAALGSIIYFWDEIKAGAAEAWDYISSLFGFGTGPTVDLSARGLTNDVGGSLAQAATGAVTANTNVKVDVDLKSDMLDARISDQVNGGFSGLQQGLQSNSSS